MSRLRELFLPIVIAVAGLGAIVIGVFGFVHRGHFGWIDALTSVGMLIPAGALLLVTSYVIQHARLVAIMPLFFAGTLVIRYPTFAVALGLALIAAIVGPLAEEWNTKRVERNKKPATE